MTSLLRLTLTRLDGEIIASVEILRAIIAGWTGRDRAGVEKHIRELEALGVKRPSTTPVYYRVAARRLTTAARIEVSGGDSSGEVEFVLGRFRGELWVGLGSDHTDRKVETYDVTVSKQMCDKPVSKVWWRFSDVEDHWDEIAMRSFIIENGQRIAYQSGLVSGMLSPADLIAGAGGLEEGAVMFCGTFAAIGGIRPGTRFEGELEDARLGRTIAFAYDIEELPVVS